MNYVCFVRGRKQDLKVLKHIEHYLTKIKTLERRKCQPIINIRFENKSYHVQIHLKGLRVNYLAHSHHRNIYQAIKLVMNKICKQIAKKRGIAVQARQSHAYRVRQKIVNNI